MPKFVPFPCTNKFCGAGLIPEGIPVPGSIPSSLRSLRALGQALCALVMVTLQSQPCRGDRLTHHGSHPDLLPGQAAKAPRRRSQGQHGPCVTPAASPGPWLQPRCPCPAQQPPGDTKPPRGPLSPPPAPHHHGELQGRQKGLKSDQGEEEEEEGLSFRTWCSQPHFCLGAGDGSEQRGWEGKRSKSHHRE